MQPFQRNNANSGLNYKYDDCGASLFGMSLDWSIDGVGRIADARACTVQGPTGFLYLDARGSPAQKLIGYDVHIAPDATQLDLENSLAAIDSRYQCVLITQTGEKAIQAADFISKELAGRTSTNRPAVVVEFDDFARSGIWCESSKLQSLPDLIVLGESVSAGRPFGAVLACKHSPGLSVSGSQAVPDITERAIGFAVGTLKMIERENLIASAKTLVDYLNSKLASLISTCTQAMEIDCFGLDATITFCDSTSAKSVARELTERGILISTAPGNRLALSLPLIVRPAEIDAIVGSLRSTLMGMPAMMPGPCCSHHHDD